MKKCISVTGFAALSCLLLLNACQKSKCGDSQTWGVKATLTSMSLNIIYKDYPFVMFNSDAIQMDKSDTVIFGFESHFSKESETKPCSQSLGEHSEYKMPGNYIRIRTVGDFDSTHKDGSDITKYFLMDLWGDQNADMALDSVYFQDVYPVGNNVPLLHFHLVKKPESNNFLKFKVLFFRIDESDGILYTTPDLRFIQ